MRNFKFLNVEQNTDEWFELRAGKLTSSKMGTIMANLGKAFGDPARKYAVSIAVEQLTGKPTLSTFQNEHMIRGHEQEPVARSLYEHETFCDVTNGGFFQSDFIGCSPDGLVGEDGVIEIKSVLGHVHFANIQRGGLDPAYKWQCISNLRFTGRKWLDFISYCAEFPSDKQLFIHRIHKENLADQFEILDKRINEFEALVKSIITAIKESDYVSDDNY